MKINTSALVGVNVDTRPQQHIPSTPYTCLYVYVYVCLCVYVFTCETSYKCSPQTVYLHLYLLYSSRCHFIAKSERDLVAAS